MGLFDWLFRQRAATVQEVAPAATVEPIYRIPTVKFDPKRVTEQVKADLAKKLRRTTEFDKSHFDEIYDAALRAISRVET